MAAKPCVALTRDIQALFDGGTAVGLTDRQLLDRFAGRGDPSAGAAFEALVRRHGPMVSRVCRQALPDPSDAQDAFQATFLVLVRRSGALGGLDSIGGWLYGVACRVAARARVQAARRRAVEGRAALRVVEAVESDHADAIDRDAIGPIVREEVERLPEKYRAAVVLCYWEGLTHEQAAAQLCCPIGTVRSRIARARDLLRRRLTRRGIAPMAGLAGSGLDLAMLAPAPVAVPEAWIAAAVGPAATLGSGGGPAAVSASVAILVQHLLRRMLIMKLKTTAIGVTFLALGAAGMILAAPQSRPDPTPTAPTRQPAANDRGATEKSEGSSKPSSREGPDHGVATKTRASDPSAIATEPGDRYLETNR